MGESRVEHNRNAGRTGFRTGPHLYVTRLCHGFDQGAGGKPRHQFKEETQRLCASGRFYQHEPIPGMAEEPGTEVHARLSVKVPACRWHKKGVPYLDTFHYIHLDGSGWNWPITTLYGDRLLPAHTGVCNSFEVCMPTMRRHTWEQQQTVLQRVLPPLLYTNASARS